MGDDPDALHAAGVTHFIIGLNAGPSGYDLGPLRELVGWRAGGSALVVTNAHTADGRTASGSP